MEDRSRWDEVEEHLDRLLDRPPEEQGAALEALARAGASAELVARLTSCLDESFLGRPAGEVVPALWSEAAAEAAQEDESWLGQRLGAWRIVEPLGEGGMGRVFLVERADGQYAMRAALKLLARAGAQGSLERFRLERQILARLDHPHIARLLDGGTTEDGRPWLVLERVEGEPIDEWCERRAVGLDGRLRLFLQVCSAVAHAHRLLVVHRDLKPDNILVSDDGQVRLLDFGIAQLVAESAAPAAEAACERALTPGYAAPEQIRGEPISTATDVWALGALLFRLLVGRGPFAAGDPDGTELLRRTLEERPAPPSAVVADRRAGRRLRGDLDAIVLSALAERPEDRYGSAQALAHDLELHLGSRPIGARPAPWTVRSAKFVRRHRLGAAAGALALALVAGALVGAVVRVRQAERDRERAERVTAFLTDVLAVGDPNSGEGFLVGADTLLRRAVERADSELGDRPDLQAAVFHQVGEVLIRLRLEPDARAALARAVELRRRLTPRGSDELIASLVRYGYTFQLSERTEEGVPALEEAVRLSRELYGADDPRHADALLELATYASRFVLAGHPRQAELLAQARERYAQALVIYRRRFGDVHPKVGAVLRNLAFATPEPAEQIALLERALAAHGNEPEPSAGLGYALADLGIVLDREGRREEAEAAMARALEILRAVEGDDALIELTVMNNLAAILRDRGRFAEAEPLYREVLARRERLTPHHLGGRAYALYGLGRVALGLGSAREAELHLTEAVELLVEAKSATLAGIARGWLGEALAAQGRVAEGEPLAAASLAELRAALGEEHAEVRVARERLERLRAGERPAPAPLGARASAGSGR